MRINLASDNWAGAHPAVAAALSEHAAEFGPAYGLSELDRAVEQRFCEIFEREVAVFPVATGTAANALSMTLLSRPGGVTFAHAQAHMLEDEGGAPEYLTGGTRLHGVPGALGRMEPKALEAAIGRYPAEFVHAGRPAAVSITQSTEIGTLYSLDEIDVIAAICRKHGLPLHMDGARFANALVALDSTPAELTWRRGIDVMSFGATKNGCWCAEAIVVMDPDKAADMPFIRKRAAHLFSKSRFIAAQFDAYFRDNLWLTNARHANAMAARLADHIEKSSRLRLAWQSATNEVFAIMATSTAEDLKVAGAMFHPWQAHEGLIDDGEMLGRFVTSFATTKEEVVRFGDMIA